MPNSSVQPEQSLALLRMRRARAILLADDPFYGLISLRLGLREDDSCKTIWSNGVDLGFNPRFVQECTDGELRAVVMKMALHATLGHSWRCERRELPLWNEACDYAVAPIIKEAGCPLPGTLRQRPEFDGWCAEAIYRMLLVERQAEQQEQPKSAAASSTAGEDGGSDGGDGTEDEESSEAPVGDSSAAGSHEWRQSHVGEVRPAPEDCDVEAKEQELRVAAEQGAMAQGNLPGNLNLALKQVGKSRVAWKEQLWAFAQAAHRAQDYSWSRPNTRFLTSGLYLPRLHGQEMPPLVASLDVSGSVLSVAGRFLTEVDAMLTQCSPTRLDVLYVDTAVRLHESYEPGDTVELTKRVPGGGGTSFVPAFDWVAQQEDEPCCLIYLTDLMGTFPAKDPGYPVLWVVIDHTGQHLASPPTVPFGDVAVLPTFD